MPSDRQRNPSVHPAFALLDRNQEAELVTHFRHAAIVVALMPAQARKPRTGGIAVRGDHRTAATHARSAVHELPHNRAGARDACAADGRVSRRYSRAGKRTALRGALRKLQSKYRKLGPTSTWW
jgi:hypothetical protein